MAKVRTSELERILAILRAHKKELEEKYEIQELGVFGSYVRGEQKKDSDVDVLVLFKPGARIGLLGFVGLENYIGELLKAEVDLVEKAALKPLIGKHILAEVVRV